MTDELREHFRALLDDAIDRATDHLDWLAQNPNEPDHEAQIADTQRSLALTLRLRDVPVD